MQEIYEGFASWLDEVLEDDLPDDVAAICFNLYDDGDDDWSVELVGASYFDSDDDDWACDEVYDTRETPFEVNAQADSDDVLTALLRCAETYLDTGKYAQKLKKYSAVAMGFVDGELNILYKS